MDTTLTVLWLQQEVRIQFLQKLKSTGPYAKIAEVKTNRRQNVILWLLGFLYMDVHNTRLMTDVQYLALLMAYFNSKLTKDS